MIPTRIKVSAMMAVVIHGAKIKTAAGNSATTAGEIRNLMEAATKAVAPAIREAETTGAGRTFQRAAGVCRESGRPARMG
jgi:hypothetical protein